MIRLKDIIHESFFKGFEATRVGRANWVEIFKNPTAREIAGCMSGDKELGVVLLDKDMYVWNREKALHVEVMQQIDKNMKDMLPMLVYIYPGEVGIYVTDAARHTKWYRQPETEQYIRTHPFFKRKTIEDITYWDEDINGKWVEESVKEGMGMDSFNKKDTYGHWIDSLGKAYEVEGSHEDEAIDIIKNLYFSGKITREEFHSLNIPLNSTSEVEHFLFDRGWLRGVIDGRGEYLVNGRKAQRPSLAQLRWMKNHGKETKRTVYWCPAGEGQIIGMKTIYSPYDIMEAAEKHKNPRLGLCYELSGRYVSVHPDAVLVHGRLVNRFGVGHKELDHAWVELSNGEVFDPVMDKIWPPGVYEGLFKTKVHKKYTHDELLNIIHKQHHWGPWDDVVTEGDRNTERGKALPQTGYPHKYVEIFRAMIATETGLKENDYVTRSRKFAVEHSDHMTSVHEELYHVMRFVVKAEHVFEAWNPGEYFYNGPEVKGTEVYNSKKFL